MNSTHLYITLDGNRKVIITDREIEWSDAAGHHVGKVTGYGHTSERGGSSVTHDKYVFFVECDDGVRELRPWQMRDIIAATEA